ncbi:MAG: hypothetical protein NZZ60_07750 [Bacteroidia bacterium]|nr:hypothetical protein [Bacteroidia bacterium]MCX7652684.1 hypothetical protein [Bacteroidia bacterium]
MSLEEALRIMGKLLREHRGEELVKKVRYRSSFLMREIVGKAMGISHALSLALFL